MTPAVFVLVASLLPAQARFLPPSAAVAAPALVEADMEAKKAADAVAAQKADEAARAEAEQQALAARGLDARVRVLCDLVALPLKRLPGDHRDQRFAVLPFANVGPEAEERRLGVVVSDLVLTNLARDHRLALVERAALGKILDEQALGQIGALADGQAAQVGKVAGARALVIGEVTDDGDAFRVAVRAVDPETAAVIEGTAQTMRLPKDELVAFSASAVVLKSKGGALFRSLVLPGWGQAYNGEPGKAGVVGAAAGTLAVSTLTAAGIGGYLRFALYDELGTRPEDKDLSPTALSELVVATRQSGETALTVAAVLAGATAAVWTLGAVDAYLSGTDVESLDAALAQD